VAPFEDTLRIAVVAFEEDILGIVVVAFEEDILSIVGTVGIAFFETKREIN